MNGKEKRIEQLRRAWAVTWLPLIVLGCFLVLHEPIESLLQKVLVDPILSRVQFIGDTVAQLAFGGLVMVAFIYFAFKWKIRYKYSIYRLVWSIVIVFGYGYLRFLSQRWAYTVWFENAGYSIKAADCLFLLPIPFVSVLWIRVSGGNSIGEDTGFSTDEPFVIQQEGDKHQRWRYIETISRLLKYTDISKRAFAIGISGIWGSGKTTFINALEKKLEKEFTQLHFNPWRITESKGITEAFFSELSYQLSLKMDTLTNDMSEYIRAITSDKSSNPFFTIVKKSLPNIRWSKGSIEELRSRINDSLNKSGIKFIIYIDDLDRLDDEEIVETLRIIRNSADFANLIFIIAYDKAQVNGALTTKFNQGNSKFLEKVFQYEFHLPSFDRNELLDELNNQLSTTLTEDDNASRIAMFDKQAFNVGYSSFKKHLNHYRDVARYINLFKVHYPFLKGQVFIPDLFKILFLRLKYPAIASLLYDRRSDFLTNFGDILVKRGGEETKYIQLEQTTDNQSTLISEELKMNGAKYGLSNGDIYEVMVMLFEIFPTPSRDFLITSNKVPNSEFTIRDVDYFDRYFDEDLNSRLSNIEFQQAFAQSKEVFLRSVEKWLENGTVATDLIKTIERRVQFNNKEDFDKLLSALACIVDYPGNGDKPFPYNWRVDEIKAFGRFAYLNKDSKDKVLKLFGGYQPFKQCILAFLNENLKYPFFRFRMVEKFAEISAGFDLLLSKEEALELIKGEFFKMLSEETETSLDLLRLYNLLNRLLPEEEHPQIRENLKEFILRKDVDGFIKWIITVTPFTDSVYHIDEWARQLFGGSLDSFIQALKIISIQSEYREEFLDFYQQVQLALNSGKGVDYEFKKIPVRKPSDG